MFDAATGAEWFIFDGILNRNSKITYPENNPE
jgi:hypothetical protein